MRGYVGVTDGEWYRFLAARPEVSGAEVNFWRPGGGGFRALAVGEPFFFKTHAPHNRVVGGGFFSGSARAARVGGLGPARPRQRSRQPGADAGADRALPAGAARAPGEDPVIGCVFIRDVTFFPDDLTFDPPPGFSSNIVQGKGYDMGDGGTPVLRRPHAARSRRGGRTRPRAAVARSGPVFGDPRLAPHRLASRRSRPSSRTPTTGSARSPGPRSALCWRPRTSGRSPAAGRTGWTTDCCCAATCTPCSTAATSPSTPARRPRQPAPAHRLRQRRAVLRQGREGHRATRPQGDRRTPVPAMAPRRGIQSLVAAVPSERGS